MERPCHKQNKTVTKEHKPVVEEKRGDLGQIYLNNVIAVNKVKYITINPFT